MSRIITAVDLRCHVYSNESDSHLATNLEGYQGTFLLNLVE